MNTSSGTAPITSNKPPRLNQRLKFAHFRAIGITAVAQQVGLSSNGWLEWALENTLLDVHLKTSQRLRKGSVPQFINALLTDRHMPPGLVGNFGFLLYLRDNRIEWGYSRVGASTEAAKWLKGATLAPLPVTKKDFSQILFTALPGKHKHSEYLLINALGNFLQSPAFQSKVGGNVTGHVLLFTELSPCESCTFVIEQLLAAYSGITITVAYVLEYKYSPAVLQRILATRPLSALRQFNNQSAHNMHWERKV